MGIFKRLRGKKRANSLEKIGDMFDHAKNEILKNFTENLSDPDIEIRKDCSRFILNDVIPIVKNQKQSYERDNAIEKVTVLAKEMRAPADEFENIALDSAAFYYSLYMLHKETPER